MASLTSFEEYFGTVFHSSIGKKSNNKRKTTKSTNNKQNNENNKSKTKSQDKYDDDDNDIKMKNKKNKLIGIKISSYKLKQSRLHRKNSINSKKNELESNLISLGYNNTKNMSLMKQRKLLDKAIDELSSKNNKSDNKKPDDDILGFMKDNNLFSNKKNKINNEIKNKNKKTKKNTKNVNGNRMDLEFGDIVEPELRKQIDEETFIRTGKSNKKISDRHLLKALKKRDKIIGKRYKFNKNNKKVIMDNHLANCAMKKLRGEKVKTDLKFMKNKLKQKYKKKLKSQKKWRQRIARKKYGINKKLDRRDANIADYKQKKINKRIGHRISAKQAIDIANI